MWPDYGPTATGSILNAYYTDVDVVDVAWRWLERQGVTHGHGFEPGCGRGTWMANLPTGVTMDGVDIDPISVRVTALLTQQNAQVGRIETWTLNDSSSPDNGGYDFVVGNVPFSANKPGRNNPHRDNLHNLAVLRSAEMLRPGGVAAVVTSRYALDAATSRNWRERLAAEVDLVAAYRLPSGTHREAGTAVVTDLLILRRPGEGEQRPEPDWIDTATFELDGETQRHNAHFAAHPERVLGTYAPGGAYSPTNFSVKADRPAHELLDEQLNAISVSYDPHGVAPRTSAVQVTTETGRPLPAGSVVIDTGSATGFCVDGVEHPCPKNQRAALAELCAMRDSVLDYLDDPSEDGRLELLGQYQAWREHSGPLNDYTVIDRADGKTTRKYPAFGGFRRDPSWWNVAALEDFDDDTHTARPAPMLQRDTISATSVDWPSQARSLTEAVANSMGRFHHIDASYVAGQLGVELADAELQLATVAYENPVTSRWEVTAEYLSGDVVAKLDAARDAAEADTRFARNVDALVDALPTRLTPAEIQPELGVTWLSAEDMTQFLHDHIGSNHGKVLYHPPTGIWSSEGYAAGGPADFRTDRKNMLEQIVAGCNAKPTTVTKKVPHGDSEIEVVDEEATAREQLCRDNINEALGIWCWSEPERSQRLCDNYNRLFNRHRSTDYDGSHLVLPGLAADFTPRPHQKDVVWRILTAADSGTLMAHGVGAGKTAAMVIAAHEARRTGRVPGTTMFAVPKNMVEQFARDYLRLYPSARIITPHKTHSKQTVADQVAEFAARVATGDFDAAICSHEAVKTIPLSPDVEAAAINKRIADFSAFDPTTSASRREQKRIERQLDAFRNKLEALNDAAADPNITYFDRLPIGMLVVDEAHLAKNIALMTARQGLPIPDGSQIAEAVLARADLVRDRHGNGAVVMATATPVTNSPAEMWVFARLTAPDALERAGISHFDAFAANFLSPIETVEHTADQKLKMVTRLADYRNFPDLARMFRSFADVRQTDQLGFDLPDVAGGQPTVHLSPPTDQQMVVTDWASERVAGKHIDLPDGVRDPVVAILAATRAASLHPATISDEICARWATSGHRNLSFTWDEPNPKLEEAADTIAAIWRRTGDVAYDDSTVPGAAQAVFCDQGVPKKGGEDSVYSVLTNALVDRGVPREQIAWVHDWPQPDKRQPLWDQVRNGGVRIVMGSTAQMGVGVNIQTRLYAAHELTAPYRPDWLTQAEGRMIRQGNSHDTVELHRYVTEKTADASAWQILERKARFITTAMSHPDDLTRNLRDESQMTTAEEYAQISALATGDQRHIELATVTGAVERLERSARAHSASRDTQQRTISHSTTNIGRLDAQAAALARLSPASEDAFTAADIGQQMLAIRRTDRSVTLAGVTYDCRRDYEGLRLEIPDTGVFKYIERERLNPADGGTGLGRTIVHLHAKIPATINERHERIAELQRQIEAEQARPVPEVFPRQGELDQARERKAQLTEELKPRHGVQVDDTGASSDETTTAAAATAHPVYGQRTPTRSERHEWAGSYQRFNTMTVPNWGNRAKGSAAWIAAVNAHTTNPANASAKPQQIGQYMGIMLAAVYDGHTVSIAPMRHHGRFNAFTVDAGTLAARPFEDWLHTQYKRAINEKTALRADERRTDQGPSPHRGPER